MFLPSCICVQIFFSVCFYFLCLAKTIKLAIESFIDLKKSAFLVCKGFYCESCLRWLSQILYWNTVRSHKLLFYAVLYDTEYAIEFYIRKNWRRDGL